MRVFNREITRIGVLDRRDPEYLDKKALADYARSGIDSSIRFRVAEISDPRLLSRALGEIERQCSNEMDYIRVEHPDLVQLLRNGDPAIRNKINDNLSFARDIASKIRERLDALSNGR